MAGKVRIEFNDAGFRAILKSNEVAADLQQRADHIAANAGEGVEVEVRTGSGDRAVAFIRTETVAAMRAEATDRTLTRALDAGR